MGEESRSEESSLVWHVDEVSSSLDVAFSLFQEGRIRPWQSVLARKQSAGRGQMRREWISPEGNIYAAMLLPQEPLFQDDRCSETVGTLFAIGLERMGIPCLLKWPNDMVCMRKNGPCKLGGILIEERVNAHFCGIGINLVSCPSESSLREEAALAATHLTEEERCGLDAQIFWENLVNIVISTYKTKSDFALVWPDEYKKRLLWLKRPVVINDHGERIEGVLEGIGERGGALLRSNGRLNEIVSGSMRLA